MIDMKNFEDVAGKGGGKPIEDADVWLDDEDGVVDLLVEDDDGDLSTESDDDCN